MSLSYEYCITKNDERCSKCKNHKKELILIFMYFGKTIWHAKILVLLNKHWLSCLLCCGIHITRLHRELWKENISKCVLTRSDTLSNTNYYIHFTKNILCLKIAYKKKKFLALARTLWICDLGHRYKLINKSLLNGHEIAWMLESVS